MNKNLVTKEKCNIKAQVAVNTLSKLNWKTFTVCFTETYQNTCMHV